jgi:hypothetical protein
VPAGTFTNCIKSRQINRDRVSGEVIFLEYKYYARGIGLVMFVREIPADQAHTGALVRYDAVTSVEVNNELAVPTGFRLCQNYPNPFNPSTVISYHVASVGKVSLKVFDLLGREVSTLINEVKSAGTYTTTFNAANMPSGVYFYRLQAGSYIETKKLILLR